ncbi:transglutaminase family protein [Rhodomicrobium sp. Az07]|uniref:transglutaminase family protein n=1 Tax=Rhodomicrobium sp. Az07 TaxID=2839034 RepID=UPI001BEAAB1B|nr:transglutaminase family protein [Rhodomicrobium sp. Az07]MBT3070139.1 transglutaminase family protein [Rhodomicrobium sp. Az07]
MNFEISHRTTYRYSAPVSQSHHVLHLTPRSHYRQTVSRHSLLIDPAPASKAEMIDDFGNPVSLIAIEQDHRELLIHSRAQVEVFAPMHIDTSRTASWNDVAATLRANLGPETFEAIQYSCPSRFIRPSRDIHKFARASFVEGRPMLEAVQDLTARIYRDFKYESGATDAATSVEEVLRIRRGVCQDFAHLEIACLRTMGLAARYVSGYLLTYPPAGQPKLIGADASHAWVSVWSPEIGWVDFDPTNNMIPGEEHIAIAIGRDFQDVSPVSGVLLGGGEHEVEVAVDVNPVNGWAGAMR